MVNQFLMVRPNEAKFVYDEGRNRRANIFEEYILRIVDEDQVGFLMTQGWKVLEDAFADPRYNNIVL